MSIQKVRDYFAQWGMADRVMELDQSSATVEEAAAALHTEGRRIAKSMSFLIGDHPILVLFAGDARVDNHKFKERFHNEGVDVFLDESLKRFQTVFPACGTANSAIELTLPELETYSHAREWVDVSKGWQEENQ